MYSLSIARNHGIGFLPASWYHEIEQDCPIAASDIEAATPDALLSYERFPARSFGLPVTWITSPSHPEVMTSIGFSQSHVDRILAWKQSRARDASKLIFTTAVSMNDFLRQNGTVFASKSTVIPFLIPGLNQQQSQLNDLSLKWQQDDLRFLFVGREANRKGLPASLAGLLPLLRQYPKFSFTIVSSMQDGPVEIPNLPNIVVRREVDRASVLNLMAESHVLVMPSSRESYGFVYLEAMSQGCIPLALDRPVQRELIDDYGILLQAQSPEAITEALRGVLIHRDMYFKKALSGQLSFRCKHSPETIADRFHAILSSSEKVYEMASTS